MSIPARAPSGALEIRGPATGLLDEPLLLRVRGAGPAAELTWRARYRDDDDRIWRATATRADDLATRWMPAKQSTGQLAALRSLRPLSIEVRVETADGRGAARTLTRQLVADGVRVRRWRDGLAATLHVPAQPQPCATVIIDATAGPAQADVAATAGPAPADVAALAAPLLASRGVLVLVVAPSRGIADPLALARERLAAVPAACKPILLLGVRDPFGEEPAEAVAPAPEGGSRVRDPFGGEPAEAVAPAPEGGARVRDPSGDEPAKGVWAPGLGARDDAQQPAGVVLPPGVGARDGGPHVAAARAAAWDELLARLGAKPREAPLLPPGDATANMRA
jgi:hypothetical protein